jgi:hypothetical protein
MHPVSEDGRQRARIVSERPLFAGRLQVEVASHFVKKQMEKKRSPSPTLNSLAVIHAVETLIPFSLVHEGVDSMSAGCSSQIFFGLDHPLQRPQ